MADRSAVKKLSLKNPWHLIALGFGSGLCPKAPGTCGSLVAAIPCGLLLAWQLYGVLAVLFMVTFIGGTYACAQAEKAMGEHDHGAVVIDEFAGMFLTALTVPAGMALYGTISTFVLFRIFDILKPFPVSWADKKVPGGLGIMLDDVLAGLYAAIANYLLFAIVL
ncbi:MAG: phosphatidylglycerophosphatase A [Candidatus Anaerobiospirillum merdipullorum]|uniref:Phosphatidylglycerophosphatase A n=1 Tax=Candidatus Anaerobiospirillum merdipullorum TaxID=2838450 RepID=A0A9E2KNS1_9GAMM|nr:phosphatidylglycerophosphatase A [Candidatus Anaerobiospirillum merdipullorum]